MPKVIGKDLHLQMNNTVLGFIDSYLPKQIGGDIHLEANAKIHSLPNHYKYLPKTGNNIYIWNTNWNMSEKTYLQHISYNF